jgi:predicted Zn-dependent protease with MMP-like domain
VRTIRNTQIQFVPHRKHISAPQPNRLMLFRETVAVYCENHTEHTNPVRTSQETHHISAPQPNRLMLFRETVTVYCENHTEHTDTPCGKNSGYMKTKVILDVDCSFTDTGLLC